MQQDGPDCQAATKRTTHVLLFETALVTLCSPSVTLDQDQDQDQDQD